jgi:C_GCAxxG_C_C family probable redox protein
MHNRRDFLRTGCCAATALAAGIALPRPLAMAQAAGAPQDPAAFARQRFLEHFNCTVAILEAFAPKYGAPIEHIRKLATPFAAGMWLGKTCGAVTGAMMALGLAYGRAAEKDANADEAMPGRMKALYALVQADFGPDLDCSALLGADMATPEGVKQAADKGLFTSKCPELVLASARAVVILTG